MKHIDSWIIRFVFLIATLATAGAQAQAPAAAYPSKPVRMVIPYPAGGTTDVIGRMLAQKLTEAWPYPVLVENKGGAAGTIGSEFVARSPADGYILVMGCLLYTSPSPRD